jgi:tetratricopeptide (TPR) repeat protein
MMRLFAASAAGPAESAQAAPDGRLAQWMRSAEACRDAGDLAGAERLGRQLLDVEPDCAPALCLLGEVAAARGENDVAEGLFRRALELADDRPHYHFALGCVLGARGDLAGAERSYRSALALAADHAGARINLGCLLQARGESEAGAGASGERAARELQEAIAHFEAATVNAPASADGWINLGYALAQQRRAEEAVRAYDRALAIEPGRADAHLNRAMARLALGRWTEAWEDYEWRWPASGFPRPQFVQPEWDGSTLSQRTLLLYTEQGYGDAIQFVRYAPLVAARGARIILRCQPELKSLFQTVPGVARVVAVADPEPAFDAHCALLSLPRLLRTTIDTVPVAVPYLSPAAKAAPGSPPDAGGSRKFRVGIVWASQSLFPGAALKSVPPAALAPLANLPGVEFHSLQMGEAGSPERRSSVPVSLRDLTGGIRDFSDTAALIAGLDLTISVDTAVAHLAGAMGRPIWTLLPYVADWRWEPDEAASRWYPTMRLFRQRHRGDWGEVLARVAGELRRTAEAAATSRT